MTCRMAKNTVRQPPSLSDAQDPGGSGGEADEDMAREPLLALNNALLSTAAPVQGQAAPDRLEHQSMRSAG